MRVQILGTLILLTLQSPLYDYLRELEGRRAAYEEDRRADARPTAVVFRPGRPLAWMSVVYEIDQAPRCGVPSESFVFNLSDLQVWRCNESGKREAWKQDYAVILGWGKMNLVEWQGGKMEGRVLR